MKLQRWRWLACGAAVYGLFAVVLAALGAHAIPLASADAERLWHTALLVHMFHAASMLAIAALSAFTPSRGITFGWILMALGTLAFSGSLYIRAAGIFLLPKDLPPAGGMLLMAAWLCIGVVLLRKDPK